jgi:hypothetical protein
MSLSSNPASHTSSPMILGADDLYIAIGAAGTTDSYITFDGADLTFYDSTVGTTKTLTQLAAGSSPTLDQAFDNGKVINGAITEETAFGVGGATDYFTFWQEGANDLRIGTSAGANVTLAAAGGTFSFSDDAIVTTGKITADGGVEIGADNVKATFGASDATDSYIEYDNTNGLTFYDQIHGATITLSDMAGSNLNSPTLTGDLTISDGNVSHTDTSDETVYTITSSSTTNDVVSINCATLTTGSALRIDLTEGTLNGGYYLEMWDDTGGAAVWTVGENGATVIGGSASGTDALTLTAGDITLTDGDLTLTTGDLVVTSGVITVADTDDTANKISRNNDTGTNPVLEIEQDHTSGGVALLVDQDATGDVNAVEITNAGTGYAVTATAGAAGGEGYEYIAATSGTGVAFRADGSTGSWIGASDVGLVDIDTDGALAAGGNLLRVDATGVSEAGSFLVEILSSGNIAGATDGALLKIAETGAAAATTYAVNISSTSNEALHVTAGRCLFSEGISVATANNIGQDTLTIDQNDATQNKDGIVITAAGTGFALKSTIETATGGGHVLIGAANQTTAILTIDGSTGDWLGGADVGMVHLHNDGTFADVDASTIYVDCNGTSANGQLGIGLHIDTAGITSGGGTEYAAYINAGADTEALKVDTGIVVVDETIEAAKGVITLALDTDVTNPPTDAELDAVTDAQNQRDGCMIFVDDAGGHEHAYLCIHDGTKWWQLTMTACA